MNTFNKLQILQTTKQLTFHQTCIHHPTIAQIQVTRLAKSKSPKNDQARIEVKQLVHVYL